jgi:uncharacterized DUF497 family protein
MTTIYTNGESYTQRGDKLCIFSARPATRKERQVYERHTNL